MTYEQTVDALTASVQVEIEYRHVPFSTNNYQVQQIAAAAKWLQGNGKFGLMLLGLPGNGKTTLMNAIISLINTLDLEDCYGDSIGVRTVSAIELARINRDNYGEFQKLCSYPWLAIDDLGQEPKEILDYGNVLTPAVELICRRYDEQLFTIVTSNLTVKKEDKNCLRSVYGDRIADRFNEMMQCIVFENKTYR